MQFGEYSPTTREARDRFPADAGAGQYIWLSSLLAFHHIFEKFL